MFLRFECYITKLYIAERHLPLFAIILNSPFQLPCFGQLRQPPKLRRKQKLSSQLATYKRSKPSSSGRFQAMDDPPPKPVKYLTRVLEELGLVSMYKSPLDTKLLCFQRFVRLFAYGGSTLILVAYLAALGHSKSHIGLFMTLTLVGDTIISLFLTLIADGLGRKAILALGALLMTASGVIFGLTGNYWVLLAAAIFGVISPR
jgi:hypothetical protein